MAGYRNCWHRFDRSFTAHGYDGRIAFACVVDEPRANADVVYDEKDRARCIDRLSKSPSRDFSQAKERAIPMSLRRRIPYVLLFAAITTPARADTPPAPPLDMREYQAFANRPPGDSTAAVNMKIHTKLVGVYAGISSAFVTLGTAYGRWQVGAYCDYVLGEASAPPRIDKGLYAANDVAQFGVDSDSVLRLHNLRVGTYLVYAAADIASATAEDAFQRVPAIDENGGTATASIPTLKFTNPQTERICVTSEIVVRAPSSHLTLEPTIAGDVILK